MPNGHFSEESVEMLSHDLIMRAVINNQFEFNVRDHLYFKSSLEYMKIFPRPLRRLIEFVFLFMAVLTFYALVYFHVNLATQPANCLDHVIDIWPKNGILRVEIIQSYPRYAGQMGIINRFLPKEKLYERDYRLENILYKRNGNLSLFNDFAHTADMNNEEVDIEPSTVELVENKFRKTSTLKPNLDSELYTNNINVEDEKKKNLSRNSKTNFQTASKSNNPLNEDSAQLNSTECQNSPTIDELEVKSSFFHQSTSTTLPPIEKKNKGMFYNNYIIEYSLNDQHLSWSSRVRNMFGIPVMVVTLEPAENKCFGNAMHQFLLEYFIGYDELLMSSAKAMAQFEEYGGFMRNCITEKYYMFVVSKWVDRASYISSFLYMITITFLISLYVRYMYHQFEANLRHILYTFNAEPHYYIMKLFTTVMASFGLVVLLSFYFKDRDVLYYNIMIVVAAEVQYKVCSYSSTTKKHWPKFFYLYLFLFYAYDYRFNGQYRFLVLTCSWFFIQHSIIYFYHHYELPNVLQQVRLQDMMIRQQLQQLLAEQPHLAGGNFFQPEG